MFEVRRLASFKNEVTGHKRSDWLRALEHTRQHLRFLNLSFDEIELLADAVNSPEELIVLTRLFYHYAKTSGGAEDAMERLIHEVEKSSFGLATWCSVFTYFYNWLEQNQEKIDYPMMLEYLSCLAAGPDMLVPNPSFMTVLIDTLDVHGVEWNNKKCN